MSAQQRGIDWGLLSYDIASMLERYGYPIDICDVAIEPHLPPFIAACIAQQAKLDEKGEKS